MGFDALVLNRPSQFLDELHPRLLERIELVPARTVRPGYHGAGAGAGGFRSSSEHGWNWDSGDDDRGPGDDVIELDRFGERRKSLPPTTQTVFKKKQRPV
jgi:hypothetical protein